MLRLRVRMADEMFNEETGKFVDDDGSVVDLEFEHSLVSLSKWESKYEVPFLGPEEKTPEQIKGYIELMELTGNFNDEVFAAFTKEHIDKINEYISSNQSATTFSDTSQKGRGRAEVITSELIYYWLVAFDIDFAVENWHLNRLFALVRICNIKASKEKKMSPTETAARNRALNEQRRRNLGTSG